MPHIHLLNSCPQCRRINSDAIERPFKIILNICILLTLLAIPINILADTSAISNPSFEQDTINESWSCSSGFADSCWSSTISGWTISGTGGTWHPGTEGEYYPDGLPDGVNVAFVNGGGSISQTLPDTPLVEGNTYTLNVQIGHRSDVTSINYAIRLYAGDYLLAEDTVTATPEEGEFQQATLTYDALPEEINLGFPIEICLASTGSTQVGFNNVTLDVSPTLTLHPIGDQTVNALDTLTIPISAIDSEGSLITLSVLGLPDFAVFTDNGDGTGEIVCNPLEDVASFYNIKVLAENSESIKAETFRLNVMDTDGSVIIAEGF